MTQTAITDSSFVREANKALVRNLLRKVGLLARAEIARRTQLSRSTVSSIVSELIEAGYVREVGAGQSSGGRRPMLLEFNYNARAIVGADIGSNHMLVVLTNLEGRVLRREEERLDTGTSLPATLEALARLVERLLRQSGIGIEQVLGVGLGVPAPLDYRDARIASQLILSGWQGINLGEAFARRLGRPVFVDNDANLGAIGEHAWGVGRGCANMAYIKLGTGVGGGLILNGEIYRGHFGSAGEIGHITIDANGPYCRCGNRGCLESIASVPALVAQAQAALDAGQASSLANQPLSAPELVGAARAGDALACALLERAGAAIGVAVAGLVNMLNPPLVVISGGLAGAGDLLLGPLRATVRQRCLPMLAAGLTINSAQLGQEAVALGAVQLVLQHTFDGPALGGRTSLEQVPVG
jgi:glucokinase-like ROK family protein